jgi:hypothetical protein
VAPGWGGPPEGGRGRLLDVPAGVLLEPVLVPAFRPGVTQAGPAARLIWRVMFPVALGGGPPAGRAGARGVPDLGQAPEPDPGIMARGLVPVVAVAGGNGIGRDEQIRSILPGPEQPGSVSAGWPGPVAGREGELRPVPGPGPAGRIMRAPRPGFVTFLTLAGVVPGRRPGAAPIACPSWSVTVTHQAVRGFRAAASARSRASSGSMGPMPSISPGSRRPNLPM